MVCEQVDVLPQASRATHERVTTLLNPVAQSVALSVVPLDVTVGVPHASVADGVAAVGTATPQSMSTLAGQVVNTGAVRSTIHVAVRDVVAVLPQPSLAVNVLVCVRVQPVLPTEPSLCVTVVGPQASVAEADPSAALISPADGLHPSERPVPFADIEGAVLSAVQVAVRDVVAVLPQPSLAVNVLVCERPQPVLPTEPSL